MSMNYRVAEKKLYTYPVNMMRWQEALREYARICGETDCHGQNCESLHRSQCTHSDPPNDYVHKKLRLEQEVRKYSEKTRAVRLVRLDLRNSTDERSEVLREVMERYYFDGENMRDLAVSLEMNERTLYRRREELVKKVMEADIKMRKLRMM